ncbi:MAG: TonB-dependent siderophore receptor [Hyphomonadaceae bacterium]|nr:TonB-dependent siderophore receptor [Hyphomonadaceae bacterium]
MKTLLLCSAAALCFTPAAAHAQNATDRETWASDVIVVTGQRPSQTTDEAATLRLPVPIRETPQSIQVLTDTLLREQQLTTLADAARNVSGVVPALPSEAVLANPIVRGFESEVFFDGLIAYGDTAVADPSSLIAVARIEVAKGPTSTLFGGGAGAPVGGLINLISKTPEPERAASFGLRFGSFDTRQASADINAPITDVVGFRVTADVTDAEDAIDRVTVDRASINPSFKFDLGDTRITLIGAYNRTEQLEYAGLPAAVAGLPGVDPFRFSGATDAPRTTIENRTLTATIAHDFSDGFTGAVQVRRYESDFKEYASFPFFAFFPPSGTQYPIIRGWLPVEIGEWTVDASVTARFATGPVDHALLAGAQYDATDYDGATAFGFTPIGVIDYADAASDVAFTSVPPIGSIFQNEYRTAALYVQDQMTIGDRLHVLTGVRFSRLGLTELQGGTNDVEEDRIDPRLGVTYDVTDAVSVYAGWATGSRLSLFFNGGGAPPKPETSENAELGVKIAARGLGLSGTVAWFTQTRENVPTQDPTSPFSSNQTGEQEATGVEIDVIWEPDPHWSILFNYAYTDATVSKDTDAAIVGDRLPRVPEHASRLAGRYRFSGALDGLGLGLGLTYASAAEITLPNTERGDDYVVADAQASYDFGRWRIGLSIENIADEEYFIPYQYLAQAVVRPGAPRSAWLSLDVDF